MSLTLSEFFTQLAARDKPASQMVFIEAVAQVLSDPSIEVATCLHVLSYAPVRCAPCAGASHGRFEVLRHGLHSPHCLPGKKGAHRAQRCVCVFVSLTFHYVAICALCKEAVQKQAEASKLADEEDTANQKRFQSHHACSLQMCKCVSFAQPLCFKDDVTVDVRAGLANIRLAILQHAQMPDSKATDEIATWARNLHRKGVKAPSPFQVQIAFLRCA